MVDTYDWLQVASFLISPFFDKFSHLVSRLALCLLIMAPVQLNVDRDFGID